MRHFSKQGRGIVNEVHVCVPKEPKHAILCLPGRAQSGTHLAHGIEEYCTFKDTLIIGLTPHGYAWYPMPRNAQDQDAAVAGLSTAVLAIEREIDSVLEDYGIDHANLAVIGFSAGAVMTLQYLLETQKTMKGVFAHSGAIFQPERVPPCKTETPIVLFHNTNDECFAWEERFLPMQESLIAQGYDVNELIDDGGHVMYAEDLLQIESFLQQEGFPSRLTYLTDQRSIVPSKLFSE